jgi:hypothetical protein
MVPIPISQPLFDLHADTVDGRGQAQKWGQRTAVCVTRSATAAGAGRLSRAGLNSTGLEVVHSSHQWRCALSRRFLAPQWSQTNISFLTGTVDT